MIVRHQNQPIPAPSQNCLRPGLEVLLLVLSCYGCAATPRHSELIIQELKADVIIAAWGKDRVACHKFCDPDKSDDECWANVDIETRMRCKRASKFVTARLVGYEDESSQGSSQDEEISFHFKHKRTKVRFVSTPERALVTVAVGRAQGVGAETPASLLVPYKPESEATAVFDLAGYEGCTVQMQFEVDANGRPWVVANGRRYPAAPPNAGTPPEIACELKEKQ